MPEITAHTFARSYPPWLERGPAAHPPRRGPQSHRARNLRRGQPSRRHAVCGVAPQRSRAAASPSRCRSRQSPSGRSRSDHARQPAAAGPDPDEKSSPFVFRLEALQNDRVRYANQPIALVVAETLEAATEGAALLEPRYEVEPARIGLDVERFVPEAVGVGFPAHAHRGDVEAGLAAAATTHRRRPTRPRRNTIMRWSRMRSLPPGKATA